MIVFISPNGTAIFPHSVISLNGQDFMKWIPKLLTTEIILSSGQTHCEIFLLE